LRRFAIPLLASALLLAACNGDEETPTPTALPGQTNVPVATATPLAQLPEPIIVTGDGAPSGGQGGEDAVTYVVESGDTVGAIAARFGVSEDVIREANDLVDDNIFIGQTLTIPRDGGSGGTDGDPEPTATPGAPIPGDGTYTVQEGDTAFGIALQFDITVEDLEAANNVGPGGLDDLQIGQVIALP